MNHRIEAVIFDLAGTTVDHGCVAPVRAMQKAFADLGVAIHDDDLRVDMGRGKRDHLAALLTRFELPFDLDALHADLERLLLSILPDYATPIAGAVDAVAALRARGCRIGATTGYSSNGLGVVLTGAARGGFLPDFAVATTEVKRGRPAPDMNWAVAVELGASSAAACVVVGDTVADMQAARNAGMWAVGVTATGSLVGLTAEELAALPDAERHERLADAYDALRDAGAHYVVDSVANLIPAVGAAEARLARRERP